MLNIAWHCKSEVKCEAVWNWTHLLTWEEVTEVNLYSNGRQKVRGHNESVGMLRLSSLGIDERLGDEKQERLSKAQLFSISKWIWAMQPFVLIGIEWELCHYLNEPMHNSSWTTLWAHLHRHFCESISAEQLFGAKWWRCVARLMMQGSKCWATMQQWSVPLHKKKRSLGVISFLSCCSERHLFERSLQWWMCLCSLMTR